MEPALEIAGYGVLMWITGFGVSYKILVFKRAMELAT